MPEDCVKEPLTIHIEEIMEPEISVKESEKDQVEETP
jgi:hypothetical protein